MTAATGATTTSFIEASTAKGTVIPQTEATSTLSDIHLTTAKEEKLSLSTDNGLSTTDSLRGNNNAAGTILVCKSLFMISFAFALVSAL